MKDIKTDGQWNLLYASSISADTSAPSTIAITKPDNMIFLGGAGRVRMRFIGDTDGDSYTVALHAIDVDRPVNPQLYMATSVLTATAVTIGTLVGPGGASGVNNDDLFADTIADPSGNTGGWYDLYRIYADGAVNAAGTPGGVIEEYSPADNTIAELLISGLQGMHGLTVTIGSLSGETANVYYRVDA